VSKRAKLIQFLLTIKGVPPMSKSRLVVLATLCLAPNSGRVIWWRESSLATMTAGQHSVFVTREQCRFSLRQPAQDSIGRWMRTAYVEAPVLSRTPTSSLLLLGSPTVPAGKGASLEVVHATGIGRASSGGTHWLVQPFAGWPSLSSPRLAQETDGTVHALWASPSARASAQGRNAIDLYYSLMADDSSWRSPTVIARSVRGRWIGGAVTSLVAARSRLAFAMASSDSGRLGVRVMTRSNAAWTSSFVQQAGLPAYVRLASQGNSGLILVTVGGGASREATENTLWVRRSENWGRTWTSPVPLHAAQLLPAHSPTVLAIGADSIGVLWAEAEPATLRFSSLASSVSTDGGRTWAEPTRWVLPLDAFDAQMIGGEPLVVVRTRDGAQSHGLTLLRWRFSMAPEVIGTINTSSATAPRLLMASVNHAYVYWAEAHLDGEGAHPAPKSALVSKRCSDHWALTPGGDRSLMCGGIVSCGEE
jgi:hypothetical protein